MLFGLSTNTGIDGTGQDYTSALTFHGVEDSRVAKPDNHTSRCTEGGLLRIYTEADLGELVRLVNSGKNALAKSALCQGGAEVKKDSQVYVMLENSLDLGEAYANGWTPIGEVNGFSAVFDGNGHTTKNVKVRLSKTSSALGAGLFGVLSETAVVKNLGVVDADVRLSGGLWGALGRWRGFRVDKSITRSQLVKLLACTMLVDWSSF